MQFEIAEGSVIDQTCDVLVIGKSSSDAYDASAYDAIHAEYARSLRQLAAAAGETAPLVVIAHSLGTVISSKSARVLLMPTSSKT